MSEDEVSVLPHIPVAPSKTPIFYTDDIARRILDLYLEGASLREISALPEMPCYATLLRWGKENGAFRRELQATKEMKALHYEEKILEITQNVCKEDVASARLTFDALKWAAEVNDPKVYGKKTTISGDSSQPLTFIVSTGFPEPNANQTPPELGSDGLIKRKLLEEVVKEESHAKEELE